MTTVGGVPYVPTYSHCTDTCTTDCGHCKGNHEQARLGQIRARAEAATPGPWVLADTTDEESPWFDDYEDPMVVSDDSEPGNYSQIGGGFAQGDYGVADARFVAATREDIPYLLDLLAEKDATIQRVRDLAATHPPCKDAKYGCNCHRVDPVEILAALDGQEGR